MALRETIFPNTHGCLPSSVPPSLLASNFIQAPWPLPWPLRNRIVRLSWSEYLYASWDVFENAVAKIKKATGGEVKELLLVMRELQAQFHRSGRVSLESLWIHGLAIELHIHTYTYVHTHTQPQEDLRHQEMNYADDYLLFLLFAFIWLPCLPLLFIQRSCWFLDNFILLKW